MLEQDLVIMIVNSVFNIDNLSKFNIILCNCYINIINNLLNKI